MIGDTGKSTQFFRIGFQGLVSRVAFIAVGVACGSKIYVMSAELLWSGSASSARTGRSA